MGFNDDGLKFNNPDFVGYARSYGAMGYKVNKTEDLEPLLLRCLGKEGIHLVETPVDYSENQTVLNRELLEKTCLL